MLVYGKWERISLTVTVYGDGADSASTGSFTVTSSQPGGALAAPEREGYTFGGWYYDIDCTEAYDPAALDTANVSVYAKWTENEPITPPVGLIGDVNGDGTVSINDVSALLNYLATASTEGVVVANLDVKAMPASAFPMFPRCSIYSQAEKRTSRHPASAGCFFLSPLQHSKLCAIINGQSGCGPAW